MKTPTVLFALLLAATTSTAEPISFGKLGGPQDVIQEEFKVPGDNPLNFCASPDDDILTIEYVDLDPNPPAAGATLSINAKGSLKQNIEEGAKVHLQVKYGVITLINQEADLCDHIKDVDLDCPLEKGALIFSKDIDLPREIPPGNYHVLADVYTKDGDKITCLTAAVSFHR